MFADSVNVWRERNGDMGQGSRRGGLPYQKEDLFSLLRELRTVALRPGWGLLLFDLNVVKWQKLGTCNAGERPDATDL